MIELLGNNYSLRQSAYRPFAFTSLMNGNVRTSHQKLVALSIHLVIILFSLSWSPSATASTNLQCTPKIEFEDESGLVNRVVLMSEDKAARREIVTVQEGSTFVLKCSVDIFHYIKWTLNGESLDESRQEELGMEIEMNETNYTTQLTVYNATIGSHEGEYKCVSVCKAHSLGGNTGLRVSVNIGINVTLDKYDTVSKDTSGNPLYKRYVYRDKYMYMECKANVADLEEMKWYRISKEGKREDMKKICGTQEGKDAITCELEKYHYGNLHSLKLHINKVRKFDNATLNITSDFREYVCEVKSSNRQGSIRVDLAESVSVRRKMAKGERSLTVTEGDKLEIYCDITGVQADEIQSRKSYVVWKKDGESINFDEVEGAKKMTKDIFRQGYEYEMASGEHRGFYTCQLIRDVMSTVNDTLDSEEDPYVFTYYVRIKDKMGALWPFLAICGEVVVLCLIIFMFERRKSNEDMDESDTEGSPEH